MRPMSALPPSAARWPRLLAIVLAGCTQAQFGGADLGADAAVDGGAPDGGIGPAVHLGTTGVYSPSGELSLDRPAESAAGDLLVLFLSRTDDLLPLRLEGWSAHTECFKSFNTQDFCLTEADCTARDGDYCLAFGADGDGRDLATRVFTRVVTDGEPSRYAWSLEGVNPSWAILSAVRGADGADPIRDGATTSHDVDPNSVFPSANAEAGDLLLLSMVFDDTAPEEAFLPPEGMTLFEYVVGPDEAGFVFGAPIATAGPTGVRETLGPGGPGAKDLMITLVVAGR